MTARGPAPDIPAPVGFASLLSSSWWILRSLFGVMFKPMLVIVAVEWLVLLLRVLSAGAEPDGIAAGFVLLVSLMLRVTTYGFGVAIGAAMIADSLAGERASARAAIRTCRPLFRELLAAALFGALLAMLALFLLQALIQLLLPLFYGPPLIAQAIALERTSFQQATRRVRELGRGQLARIFGYLMSVALLIGIVGTIVPRLGAELAGGLGDAGQVGVFVLLALAVSAIALAFFSAVTTVAYFDLRARAENYGLEELKAERGSASS